MSMSIKLMDPADEDREHSTCYPVDFQMPGSYFDDFRNYLEDENGIGWLEGKRAGDCVDRLWSGFQMAVEKIPGESWYYSPGFFLMLLWSHARSHPDGVFSTCY